jgi:hypothetical protein
MKPPRVTKAHDPKDIRPKEWKSILKRWFRDVRKQGGIEEAEYLQAMRIIDTHEASEALVALIERGNGWDPVP